MTTTKIDTSEVQVHVQEGHAEAAAPTHGGHCPDCVTQTTGPAWDWVERGTIRGTYGTGQCGGCGQLSQGWVHTGAKVLPDDPADHEAFIDALMVECVGLRDQAYARMRSQIRADLAAKLTGAVAAKPAGPFDAGAEVWDNWIYEFDVSFDNSGGDGPIFYDPDHDVVTAWAYDPAGPDGRGIEVLVEDLTGSRR